MGQRASKTSINLLSAGNRASPAAKAIIASFFLLGLSFRGTVFTEPHGEGDEMIYMALVEQLDKGRGYSLQGHPLLETGHIDRKVYDHPLFQHPPGGSALFLLLHRVMGYKGYAVAQLVSFVVFFTSLMFVGFLLIGPSTWPVWFGLAALAAFNPIMAHVSTNFWIDAPMLAFSTLAVAMFLYSVVRDKTVWTLAAGVVLGYASLIKVTAVLVVPGTLLLAWPLLKKQELSSLLRAGMIFLGAAALIHLPWEIWQWFVYGDTSPRLPGVPSEDLLRSNRYLHYLTVVRSPWHYLKLTPRILWTLIPSVLALLFVKRARKEDWIALSLTVWIATVLIFNFVLGFHGYAKVMRYLILMVPASILLFAMAFSRLLKARAAPVSGARKTWVYVMLGLMAVTLCMEIVEGMNASIAVDRDLIIPFFGGL